MDSWVAGTVRVGIALVLLSRRHGYGLDVPEGKRDERRMDELLRYLIWHSRDITKIGAVDYRHLGQR